MSKQAGELLRLNRCHAAILALALVACGDSGAQADSDAAVPDGQVGPSTLSGEGLRLMSLNMYLGADLARLAEAAPEQIALEVAWLWQAVGDSAIEQRVAAMAAAIARLQPHVIGLQEAVLLREQTPGDFLQDNPVQASEVVWDFLALLQAALADAGQTYQVAVSQQSADIEAPRLDIDATVADARLTDRDVILVREGVDFSAPATGIFDDALDISSITVERGYVAVDIVHGQTTYRIVNTHLEALDEGPAVRIPQAQQLIDLLASETRPLILLGDFNSPAPAGGAYGALTQAGYQDLWLADVSAGGGASCCQAANLRGDGALSGRIDLIFARNLDPAEVEAVTALDHPAERTAEGLWPTDHAAVAIRLLP